MEEVRVEYSSLLGKAQSDNVDNDWKHHSKEQKEEEKKLTYHEVE
jgi:hypothetical protein